MDGMSSNYFQSSHIEDEQVTTTKSRKISREVRHEKKMFGAGLQPDDRQFIDKFGSNTSSESPRFGGAKTADPKLNDILFGSDGLRDFTLPKFGDKSFLTKEFDIPTPKYEEARSTTPRPSQKKDILKPSTEVIEENKSISLNPTKATNELCGLSKSPSNVKIEDGRSRTPNTLFEEIKMDFFGTNKSARNEERKTQKVVKIEGDEIEVEVRPENTNPGSPNARWSRVPRLGCAHSLSTKWPLMTLMLACMAYYVIHLMDYRMPRVITKKEAILNPTLFSGERSKEFSVFFQGRQRLAAADELTGILIKDQFSKIIASRHESQYLIYEEHKVADGAFTFGSEHPVTYVYSEIGNIMIKLEGSKPDHSILVNCHYDSAIMSEGASSALSCAVMLELIQVLSQAPARLDHSIIFLFNGAKESGLQGSHLFLQNPWASQTRLFLNLDSMGQGGRSLLSQTAPGNSWLFYYYARNAPHPHGLVLLEELFQDGALPQETDFKIFREYGNLTGLDFTFKRNGYVYHTSYDKEAYIRSKSHQHIGDNILALLRALGNAPELNNIQDNTSTDKVIYFDYLGWFLVRYSQNAGIAINFFVFLISTASVVVFIGRLLQWQRLPRRWGPLGQLKEPINKMKFATVSKWNSCIPFPSLKKNISKYSYANPKECTNIGAENSGLPSELLLTELAFAVGSNIGSTSGGLLAAVLTGLFINGTFPLAMPWFSNVWLIFPLFWFPYMVASGFVTYFVDRWRADKNGLRLPIATQLHLVAAQIPWSVALLLCTCAGVRSSAMLMIPALFSALANIFIHLSPLYFSAHKWIWVYLLINVPSIIFQMYIVLMVYVVFIPVMGRSGSINSDLYMAFISALLAAYLLNFIMPLLIYVKKSYRILIVMLSITVIMLVVSSSTSIGHPYRMGPNYPVPQRYTIVHTKVLLSQQTTGSTGFIVLNHDPNGYRTIPKENREILSLKNDCEEKFYCAVSQYGSIVNTISEDGYWIPLTTPIALPTLTTVQHKKQCSPRFGNDGMLYTCELELQIKGPERITITFVLREGVTLEKWNIPTEPKPYEKWKGQPVYILNIIRRETTNTFELKITLKVNRSEDSDSPLADFGVTGNYIDVVTENESEIQNGKSNDLKMFLNDFPDWVDVTTLSSSHTEYTF